MATILAEDDFVPALIESLSQIAQENTRAIQRDQEVLWETVMEYGNVSTELNRERHAPAADRVPGKPQFASEFVSQHETEVALEREYYVVQHNDMVQKQRFTTGKNAGNSLTVTEEKVLAFLISKIKPDATSLEPIEMEIKTFCEVCGLGKGSTDNCYPHVKAAVEKLAGRVMWLYDDNTKSETTVRYIERVTMYKRSGKIRILFDPMLEPYLINLAGNYFQFSYHNILAMKSKYGIQLYKLLKSYYFRYPCLRISVEELKASLDATNYVKVSHVKEKVIEPALRDINTYSDLSVNIEYEKQGRTITHVVFSMNNLEHSRNEQHQREAQRRYYNAERALYPDEDILTRCY